MSSNKRLHLFEGFGVELEYMIVDAETLQVKPIADEVIYAEAGAYVSDVEFGSMAWSNELVLHVIELKTNGPAAGLINLAHQFQEQVSHINKILSKHHAILLPTGAHPLMNPFTETKLWPHEYNAVYQAYDKIFDTKGHGWSNLQSTHLNLPFANDEEFASLHAAIRLLLPIIPAISASSPILDGQLTGFSDTRLEVYRKNQAKIPSIAGRVVPEQVFSEAAYREKIFGQIYQDIAPYDPDEILQDEFLNSRGAIARFERGAIEIRIIDIQECPQADLAILTAVVGVLKLLVAEKWQSLETQKAWHENDLAPIFEQVIKDGSKTNISDQAYLNVFGLVNAPACTAAQLWQHLLTELVGSNLINAEFQAGLQMIIDQGNLSERIKIALANDLSEQNIRSVYHKLALCLDHGTFFQVQKI